MTADCTLNSWAFPAVVDEFLEFTAGTFTINGNGHSIIGPSNGIAIGVRNSGTTLNLNDVTIRGGGGISVTVWVQNAGTLNARNVIFSGNRPAGSIVLGTSGAQISLENVQFLDNRMTTSAGGLVTSSTNVSLIVITNGIFRRNRASRSVVDALGGGTMQLEGCMVFDSNTQLDGVTALTDQTNSGIGSTLTDNSDPASCLALTPQPKKKKEKVPTAMPTSTPRPQIAATHIALQAATGATFGATFGLDSGVHFRQLDGAGIGIQSIIDAGYLEAFDVWGYVEQGVEVCFPQVGRVIFLDANTSPRAIVPLASTVVNGQTCVSINSPGSLVLLPN